MISKEERKERIIKNLKQNTKNIIVNDFINEYADIFSEVLFNDVCAYYEIDEEYNEEVLRIIITIIGGVTVRITTDKDEDGKIYCIFTIVLDHTVLVSDTLPPIELKDKLISVIDKIHKVQKEDTCQTDK